MSCPALDLEVAILSKPSNGYVGLFCSAFMTRFLTMLPRSFWQASSRPLPGCRTQQLSPEQCQLDWLLFHLTTIRFQFGKHCQLLNCQLTSWLRLYLHWESVAWSQHLRVNYESTMSQLFSCEGRYSSFLKVINVDASKNMLNEVYKKDFSIACYRRRFHHCSRSTMRPEHKALCWPSTHGKLKFKFR